MVEKSTVLTFTELFKNMLSYITYNRSVPDYLNSAKETISYKILLFVEYNSGGPDDLMANEEVIYKMVLLVMCIGELDSAAFIITGEENLRLSTKEPRITFYYR